jgi:hypothetical protein
MVVLSKNTYHASVCVRATLLFVVINCCFSMMVGQQTALPCTLLVLKASPDLYCSSHVPRPMEFESIGTNGLLRILARSRQREPFPYYFQVLTLA